MESIQLSQIESNRAEGSLLGNSAIFEHLKALGFPESSISSIKRCGYSKGFKMVAKCECTARVFDLTWQCNQRVCESCSQKRKRRLRRKYAPLLDSVPLSRDRDKFYFLTISPQNFGSFSYGFSKIKEDLKKFMRLQYFRERVKGGLYVTETKFHPETGWNIHVHMILYGRRLDNSIRGTCLHCGQHLLKYDPFVHRYFCANHKCLSEDVSFYQDSHLVRMYKDSSGADVNIEVKQLSSRAFAFNYMLKYISANKDDFGEHEDSYIQVAEYMVGSRKKRLVNTFGFFFNFKSDLYPIFCLHCGARIHYIFDDLLSYELSRVHPYEDPPPALFLGEDLRDYL